MIMRNNKYGARKYTVDGITFDSRKEARRYQELKLLQRAGRIAELRLQVRFELLPAQYEKTDAVYVKGPRKGQPKRGRCIENSVVYIADFVYTENGRMIAEDVKGMRTKDYILKRKLFRYFYGESYEFREV